MYIQKSRMTEECPICFEPCEVDFLVTECCRKHFHTSCHTECMKVNRACPTCRSVTVEVEPETEVEVRVSRPFFCRETPCCLAALLIGLILGYMIYYMIDQFFLYNNDSIGHNSTESNKTFI